MGRKEEEAGDEAEHFSFQQISLALVEAMRLRKTVTHVTKAGRETLMKGKFIFSFSLRLAQRNFICLSCRAHFVTSEKIPHTTLVPLKSYISRVAKGEEEMFRVSVEKFCFSRASSEHSPEHSPAKVELIFFGNSLAATGFLGAALAREEASSVRSTRTRIVKCSSNDPGRENRVSRDSNNRRTPRRFVMDDDALAFAFRDEANIIKAPREHTRIFFFSFS